MGHEHGRPTYPWQHLCQTAGVVSDRTDPPQTAIVSPARCFLVRIGQGTQRLSGPVPPPAFPATTGVSDTLRFMGHFLPIVFLVVVIELIPPATVWMYIATELRARLEEQQRKAVRLTPSHKPVRTRREFLANPWKIWTLEDFALKRTVLRLAFSGPLAYDRQEGYRTPRTSLPFKVLGGFNSGECKWCPRRDSNTQPPA